MLRRLVGVLDVPVAAVWLDKIAAPDLPYPFSWLATIATNLQQSGVSINGVPAIAYRRP